MKKKLVVVVHGIGEQIAGETLDLLVGGLDNNGDLSIEDSTRQLRETGPTTSNKDRSYKLFPCHTRRVDFGGSETVFAEAFWADISRGRTGRLWTAIELFQVVLGLGHLVRENASNYFSQKHISQRLADWIVALIHGPIASLNLLLFLSFLATYVLHNFWFKDLPSTGDIVEGLDKSAHFGVAAIGILSLGLGLLFGGRILKAKFQLNSSTLMQFFFDWLAIVGAFLLALVLYRAMFVEPGEPAIWGWLLAHSDYPKNCAGQNNCSMLWYAVAMLVAMNAVWLAIYGLAVWMLVSVVIHYYRTPKPRKFPLFPAFISGMVLFWIVIVVTIWIGLKNGSGVIFQKVGLAGGEVKSVTGILTPVWFLILSLVLVATLVWWVRRRRAQKSSLDDIKRALAPRIILNKWLARLLIASLLVLIVYVVLVLATVFGTNGTKEYADTIIKSLDKLYRTATVLGILAVTAYSIGHKSVATGLGVVKDVATYFNGSPLSHNSSNHTYPYRDRINRRFEIVLETLLEREKPSELLIIAHSQGTVIAVEALRRPEMAKLIAGHVGKNASLVTMGSPISHIYEEYFGRSFPPPVGFNKFFQTWLNIFRLDDFVGTTIEGASEEWPVNIPVNAGGHTGYWTDGEVRAHLTTTVLTEFKN